MAEEKTDDEKQQAMQQAYMEFQMFHEQMKQMQKQMEKAEEQLMEVEYMQQSLQELSEAKEGTEILVPVANGIFTKAKVMNTKQFIVNVGAETGILKNVDDVKQMLAKQATMIAQAHEEMHTQMKLVIEKTKEAEESLNNIAGN